MSFSSDLQIRRQGDIDRLVEDVDADLQKLREIRGKPGRRDEQNVRCRIRHAVVQMLHAFDCVIDVEMERRFGNVTEEFVRKAYEFDPAIDEESVYQASRNVLIMNSFQMHFEREVTLTPSVLAYSLLYPYTDNYIDDAGVGEFRKSAANAWLSLRLAGKSVRIRSPHEEKIDRLVRMIEGEFDRNECPCVYESLLAIHRAQIRSVSQGSPRRLAADELLDISIEKGGTSVLADAFLVAGGSAVNDAAFVFRFGVVLQLIDDLQDIEEDRSSNRQTPAGMLAGEGPLDTFASRLLSFLVEVVEAGNRGQRPTSHRLTSLIDRSCRLLILEAIARHPDSFTDTYLAEMERRSPVSLDYLRSMAKRSRMRFGGISSEFDRWRSSEWKTPRVAMPA